MGMNKSWWSGLSATDQLIIESAALQECELFMSENNANNGTYLERLIKEQGVEVREFSDEIYDAFGAAAKEVLEATRAHSDLTNRIYESFDAARTNVGSWLKLADVSYSVKRNRVLGL
jgi:TRAP-type mannitol/chloroaromatic compound transport system substrate-binding protein